MHPELIKSILNHSLPLGNNCNEFIDFSHLFLILMTYFFFNRIDMTPFQVANQMKENDEASTTLLVTSQETANTLVTLDTNTDDIDEEGSGNNNSSSSSSSHDYIKGPVAASIPISQLTA